MYIEGPKPSRVERLEFRVPGVNALRIPLYIPNPSTPLSSSLLLILGFAGLILLGALFLMFPISSASGQFTSPLNAFFTATSAVCLTGMEVVETGNYWSHFGQGVLLALFQLGGFGFITGATLLLMAIGGRLGLRDRLLLSDSTGIDRLGGITGLIIRLGVFTLIIEGLGAVVFHFQWRATGVQDVSLWTAVFHAVSSFNNCGLDIMGGFNSLAGHQNNYIFLLVTAVLAILGSTGYIVIEDLCRHGKSRKPALDSKIVLVVTLSLLAAGTLFYFVSEFSRPETLGPMPVPQKAVVAFFQSAAARTAGFSVINIGSIGQFALLFTMFLMFIGGAVGSASGGLKVNTLGILVIAAVNVLKGNENISAFGRQLARQTIYRAMTLLIFFLGMAGLVIMVLSITESFPLDAIVFESIAALSTAGLSTGITPELSAPGQTFLIFVMFTGRLAPLALVAFLTRHRQPYNIDYPYENVRLG